MLLHPTYFSTIIQYAAIIQSKEITFEVCDNFQKQTYRNRCYIYGANGKQLLNIPIQKGKTGKQLAKEVKIDYSSNWQSEHLKTLFSAYNSSPFFEYYIDDLQTIFSKKETYLMDLNIKTFDIVMEILQEQREYAKTEEYEKEVENDYRILVKAKGETAMQVQKYTQVFDDKHGFIPNLSIVDLLFMEGTASLLYLEKLVLPQI